jgi:hypothetical protein
VEIHPVFEQWSESGWLDFGQQGWARAIGPGAIAAQATDADSNTNVSNSTGIPLSISATECALIRIAQ